MKYENQTLVSQLAAEYVLGTLHGKARLRFERLAQERADVQQQIDQWREHFSSLDHAVQPASPPASVWRGIQKRLRAEPRYSANAMRFWQVLSGFASTLAIACLAFIAISVIQPPIQTDERIALIGENEAPLWVISADLATGQLQARAVNAQAQSLDKAYELWMLPNDGSPQSIGLLPVNGQSTTLQLPAALTALLKSSQGLAVSIEPAGGSPTGVPTGPVIQSTKIWQL